MLRLRQWRQLGTTKLPSFLLSLFPFFDFLPDMPAFGLIILCFGFIDSNCQLTAVGEVAFVPNWFGTNHHRVERCAVQQRGWPIPGRHLLFIAIRAHLGQAHRGHPRVQKAQENGHYWSLRWVKQSTKSPTAPDLWLFRSLRQDQIAGLQGQAYRQKEENHGQERQPQSLLQRVLRFHGWAKYLLMSLISPDYFGFLSAVFDTSSWLRQK